MPVVVVVVLCVCVCGWVGGGGGGGLLWQAAGGPEDTLRVVGKEVVVLEADTDEWRGTGALLLMPPPP